MLVRATKKAMAPPRTSARRLAQTVKIAVSPAILRKFSEANRSP